MVFMSQDSSEKTERNITQASLGRKENGLIHINENPEVGLASGIQMAFSGSSRSLLICSCLYTEMNFLLHLGWGSQKEKEAWLLAVPGLIVSFELSN